MDSEEYCFSKESKEINGNGKLLKWVGKVGYICPFFFSPFGSIVFFWAKKKHRAWTPLSAIILVDGKQATQWMLCPLSYMELTLHMSHEIQNI